MTLRPLKHYMLAALVCALLSVIIPHLPQGSLRIWLAESPLLSFTLAIVVVLVIRLVLESLPAETWLRRALGLKGSSAPSTDPPLAATARGTAPGQRSQPGWCWLMAGLAVVLAAIFVLERMQPCYFTQDDNLSQFLPTILQGCRSAEAGVFPDWNPYQLLGAPTASLGVYALTYPLTYLSYFTARHWLGNEYLTLEVFCILHLVLGYFATFVTARQGGLRPALAMAGSLSFVLSGYTLIAGRSWYYMTPVVLWAPLLAASVMRLHRGRVDWKWVLGTGAVIGLFFHAGNAQMWIYALLLVGAALAMLVWSGQMSPGRALWCLPALLLGLALAAPLLLSQMKATAHLARVGGGGSSVGASLLNLLLPYPLSFPSPSLVWGTSNLEYRGQFYFSGSLFFGIALALSLLLACFRFNGELRRKVVGLNVWLACAAIALLFASGGDGFLWTILSKLPVFNKLEHPVKFFPYAILFVVLGAGLVLERLLRDLRQGWRWDLALGITVSCLMLYHCSLARPAFYSYGDHPYPSLPPTMAALLQSPGQGSPGANLQSHVRAPLSPGAFTSDSRRIMPFAPIRSIAPGYISSLQLNFPSVFGVLSAAGYDPLVAATTENSNAFERIQKDPLQGYRAYGVHWLVVHRLAIRPVLGPNHVFNQMEQLCQGSHEELKLLESHAIPRLQLPDVAIWELPGTSPLAFPAGSSRISLPIQFDGRGARVDVSSVPQGGPVVVNVLLRPEMAVYVDGLHITAGADQWGRVQADTPPGAHFLEVRCCPPWIPGILVGLALALLACCSISLLNLLDRRLSPSMPQSLQVSSLDQRRQ